MCALVLFSSCDNRKLNTINEYFDVIYSDAHLTPCLARVDGDNYVLFIQNVGSLVGGGKTNLTSPTSLRNFYRLQRSFQKLCITHAPNLTNVYQCGAKNLAPSAFNSLF